MTPGKTLPSKPEHSPATSPSWTTPTRSPTTSSATSTVPTKCSASSAHAMAATPSAHASNSTLPSISLRRRSMHTSNSTVPKQDASCSLDSVSAWIVPASRKQSCSSTKSPQMPSARTNGMTPSSPSALQKACKFTASSSSPTANPPTTSTQTMSPTSTTSKSATLPCPACSMKTTPITTTKVQPSLAAASPPLPSNSPIPKAWCSR